MHSSDSNSLARRDDTRQTALARAEQAVANVLNRYETNPAITEAQRQIAAQHDQIRDLTARLERMEAQLTEPKPEGRSAQQKQDLI